MGSIVVDRALLSGRFIVGLRSYDQRENSEVRGAQIDRANRQIGEGRDTCVYVCRVTIEKTVISFQSASVEEKYKVLKLFKKIIYTLQRLKIRLCSQETR